MNGNKGDELNFPYATTSPGGCCGWDGPSQWLGNSYKTEVIITKYQLGQMEEQLPKGNFVRIHRSFIVAKEKTDAFTGTDIEIGSKQLPIGRSYKELVNNLLDGISGMSPELK
jgi:hypothetical protein